MKEEYRLNDFVEIIKTLRSEKGCPWDKIQTHDSLKQCMLEEAYEVVDAIENNNMSNLCEELGDILLQVVFHAQIEDEKSCFTINDVISGICKKMLLRHPHIFSDGIANDADEVLQNWEEIKKKEKKFETQTQVLKSVPKTLPALMRASKVQSKAGKVGFDFENQEDSLNKVYEEISELKEALLVKNGNIQEEFGDILFSIVNLSRFLKINPEFALTNATEKFINRFEYVENSARNQARELSDMSLRDMDSLWEESKQHEF